MFMILPPNTCTQHTFIFVKVYRPIIILCVLFSRHQKSLEGLQSISKKASCSRSKELNECRVYPGF